MESRILYLRTIGLALILVVAGICEGRTIAVPQNFETIQQAVDNSHSGDTILVAPGDYQYFEAHGLHDLTFLGAGLEADQRSIIHGVDGNDIVGVLLDNCSNIEFAGFEVTDGYTGIWLHRSQNVHVHHNLVQDTESGWASSISMDGCVHLLIERNVLLRSWHYGLYIVWGCSDVVVRHNVIAKTFNNDGIHLDGVSNVNIYNNIIYNCSDYGIYFLNQNQNIHIAYNDIFGNGSFCNVNLDQTNITGDPSFVNDHADDYHLRDDSPCINAGDPNSEIDPDGSRADIGCFFHGEPMHLEIAPDSIVFDPAVRGGVATVDFSITYVSGARDPLLLTIWPAEGSDWLSVNWNESEMELGDELDIRATARVPEDAEVGDLAGGINIFVEEEDRPLLTIPATIQVLGASGSLTGRVFDARSNDSVVGATIMIQGLHLGTHLTQSNAQGRYTFDREPVGTFGVSASRPDFLPFTGDSLRITENDSTVYDIGLRYASCNVAPDSLDERVMPDSTARVEIQVSNAGSGPLEYQAGLTVPAGVVYAPFSERTRIPAEEVTGDQTLSGVEFVDDHYYVSGGNNGGGRGRIYVLNRNGELERNFDQFANSATGMLDLAWDGSLLWGSIGRTCYGFTPEGQLVRQFNGPLENCRGLAFDPKRGLLWMGGDLNSIYGVDRNGNTLVRLGQFALDMQGLAWYVDDPEGANLYVFTSNPGSAPELHKIDTERRSHSFVAAPPVADALAGGLAITHDFDPGRWTLVTLLRRDPVNGDSASTIRAYQLADRLGWLQANPLAGEVAAESSEPIELSLSAAGLADGDTMQAEIHITHNGRGGEGIVPVTMFVDNGVSVKDEKRAESPGQFKLQAPSPNPFNSTTTIRFELPADADIRLTVHDNMGRLIRNLASGHLRAGEHSIVWDAGSLPTGIYLLRLQTERGSYFAKGVLVK